MHAADSLLNRPVSVIVYCHQCMSERIAASCSVSGPAVQVVRPIRRGDITVVVVVAVIAGSVRIPQISICCR